MPEGDSIHRAKLRVSPVLVGQEVTDIWFRKLRGHRPRSGQTITSVEALGKHLLIEFETGLVLQVHLGMTGWWRTAAADMAPEDLHRNPKLRIRISTSQGHALCYAAPTIQTFHRDAPTTPVDHIGPDLTAPDPDLDEVLRRARQLEPHTVLADAVLHQGVASGIGNIFKSESLHRSGLHPLTRLDAIDDATLKALFATAAGQLQANVRSASQQRTTTPHGGFFVYMRDRRPCLRCGSVIERTYAGQLRRSTYWCPTCQPEQTTSREQAR